MRVVCEASPSLALIKYWGKQDPVRNIPATPSLAVALAELRTTTRAVLRSPPAEEDLVRIDGVEQPEGRFEPFFAELRRALDTDVRFQADSSNNFPTSAGLASSSSGFAALAHACTRAAGVNLPLPRLSSLARLGSASAARAVYGGYTLLPAGAEQARPLFPADHWPELRIIVCVVERGTKAWSSRAAMEASRITSPYFGAWVESSEKALPQALRALERRDLEELGEAIRLSYLRMFATIISTDPPTQYWLPASVAIINECAALRRSGIGVWETMDAGPQVKLFCLASEAARVREQIEALGAAERTIECTVGDAPICRSEREEA